MSLHVPIDAVLAKRATYTAFSSGQQRENQPAKRFLHTSMRRDTSDSFQRPKLRNAAAVLIYTDNLEWRPTNSRCEASAETAWHRKITHQQASLRVTWHGWLSPLPAHPYG